MAIINETSDLPDFFNDTAPIQEGDTFNGTSSPQFDEDWIPVQLFADRSYIIQRSVDDGRGFVSVFNEAGEDISTFEGGYSGGVQTTVTVPTDGVYYIVTSGDRFSGDSLPYTISVISEIGDTQRDCAEFCALAHFVTPLGSGLRT